MSTKKNIKTIIVVGVVFLTLMVYGSWEDANSAEISRPVKLSMVSAFFTTGPYAREKNIVGYLLMEKFNAKARGKYEINVVGGPEVISPYDHLKVLRSGQFDLAITAALYFAELREIQVHDYTPFEKQVELAPAYFQLLQNISREKADVIWLSPMSMGVTQHIWTTKKKITSPGDLKGLKIRCYGDTRIPLKEFLGVVPVNIPPNEVYSALQTGLIDGALRGIASIDFENEGEVLKFGVPFRGLGVTGDIFMSGRAWDKLPEDIKQLLNACGREAEQESLKTSYDRMKVIRANIEKRFGVTIVEPDPELKQILDEIIPRETVKILIEKSKYRDEIIENFKFGKIF